MTAAMMLPSEVPAALLVARFRRGLPTVLFIAGYLAVWTAYGLAAYALFRFVTSFDTGWLAWDEAGPYLAGGGVAAAGIYELTSLKQVSLRRCRRPHADGPALRSGLASGLHCVGCSGGLMAVLFALGLMSVVWMVVVAGAIFAEKVLPQGLQLTRPIAVALLALALWVAVSPSTVPGLTEPGMSPAMQVES
jgi:predicted metal-binding membrane protein